MHEQGATTLRDVLRNVPGLTITAGEGGNPAGDNLTLRGFSARNDIFIGRRARYQSAGTRSFQPRTGRRRERTRLGIHWPRLDRRIDQPDQ